MKMYKLNEQEMFSDITDNIAVIINAQTGIYYGMNSAGTLVYKSLIEGNSVTSILDYLKKIPQVPVNIEEKLNVFIDELFKKNIIIEGSTVENSIAMDSAILIKDNFELKVGEYMDAQELLLADPIHDVEKEEGWNPILKEMEKPEND